MRKHTDSMMAAAPAAAWPSAGRTIVRTQSEPVRPASPAPVTPAVSPLIDDMIRSRNAIMEGLAGQHGARRGNGRPPR